MPSKEVSAPQGLLTAPSPAPGKAASTVYLFSLANPFDFLCRELGQFTPTSPCTHSDFQQKAEISRYRQLHLLTDLELWEETRPQPEQETNQDAMLCTLAFSREKVQPAQPSTGCKTSWKPSESEQAYVQIWRRQRAHKQQERVPLLLSPHLSLIWTPRRSQSFFNMWVNTQSPTSPGYFCYLCCLRHEVVGVRVIVKIFIVICFSAVVLLLAQPRATYPRCLCGCWSMGAFVFRGAVIWAIFFLRSRSVIWTLWSPPWCL